MKSPARTALLTVLFCSSPALAAGGAEGEGMSLMVKIFIGFVAAIVVLQLLPSLVLFSSMIAAFFKRAPQEGELVENGEMGESAR